MDDVYYNEIESISHGERVWHKVKTDNAFIDILDGFESYRPVYEKFIRSKGVVVQAGGYCGVFPRLLAEMFETVYTFEPDSLNFFCLNLNCQNPNIIKAQGALGNDYGLVSVIHQHRENRGMNYVLRTHKATIPTYRIDDLDLQSCDLIQLDTEGYEFKILQGSKNTIERFKPVISVEDANDKIIEFLKNFGYSKVAEVYRDTVFAI